MTDDYGFFGIVPKISQYLDSGYEIVNAYAKNGALTMSGDTLTVCFSLDSYSANVKGYGYIYKTEGGTVVPLANATNVTMIVIMGK